MVVGGVLGLRHGVLEAQRVLVASFRCRSHRINEIVRYIKVVEVSKYLQKAALARGISLLLLLKEGVDLAYKSSH